MRWRLDHAALRAEAQFDGLYCLVTNLAADAATAHDIFRHYQERSLVEIV